jgi:hypothetical protein
MKVIFVLCWKICTAAQILMRSYHVTAKLNPYCDRVGRGFEVGYVPAETLCEISLLCHRENLPDS